MEGGIIMAQYAADTERVAPVVATVANPSPLGLSAFALTTFVLSCINANIFNGAVLPNIVVGLALFYGGIAQMLAGMWEFRTGNTFGATAFTSYGAFWLALGSIFVPGFGIGAAFEAAATKGANLGTAVGLFLLGWTIFTFIMFLGTLKSNGALIALFGLLFLTFVFLTIGNFGAAGMVQIGGYLGILTAIVAWYTALAGVLSSGRSAFQLPVFPMR
jgi:succinate-acetate transporter protein